MSNAGLEPVLVELRRARGLDLSDYRLVNLERRLAARLANLRLKDPGKYLAAPLGLTPRSVIGSSRPW